MSARAAALLHASGLPARWRGRDGFVLLDAQFRRPASFLATWQAWRDDPARCARLCFIGAGPGLPSAGALAAEAIGQPPESLAGRLAAAWPPLTPNLHRVSFEDGRVVLLLAPGPLAACLRDLVARVDAFLVDTDAAAAPLFPPGGERLGKAFARLAAPAATWAGSCLDAGGRRSLQSAGFCFDEAPAPPAPPPSPPPPPFPSVAIFLQTPPRPDRTVAAGTPRFAATPAPPEAATTDPGAANALRAALATGRYAPSFRPRTPAGRASVGPRVERHALVVGAGLAGCAAAWALAEQGWQCTVLERRGRSADEASGNPAGLFHGIVNGQDGSHARLLRAAALQARIAAEAAIRGHGVAGSVDGLLQLASPTTTLGAMRTLLARLALPPGYVRAVDASEGSALAGVGLPGPAWFYPGGGWIDPRGLARSFLERAGAAATLRTGQAVAALRRRADRWELVDDGGAVLASSATVILANSFGAARLAGMDWPLDLVRGQLSVWRPAGNSSAPLPRLPITGAGYVLPLSAGAVVFGATSAVADPDPAVRLDDHRQNLAQLARLAPSLADSGKLDIEALTGRTAWRCTSRDRLPLVGAVPGSAADASAVTRLQGKPPDQPRFVARKEGLYVFAALGSRGITWAALGAQVLAAHLTRSPQPLESGLLDALDPARFIVRRHRRSSAPRP